MKFSKAITTLLFAVTVGVAPLIASLPQEQKEKPIRAVTPQQKEHSRLFNGMGSRKLTAEQNPSGSSVLTILEPPIGAHAQALNTHPSQFLARAACQSDAVVIVRMSDRQSLLTENETFIFSEYTAVVEEILKDNPAAQIVINDNITVIRPGGTLEINGQPVSAASSDFGPFIVGRQYLLYLKFIPETRAYQAFPSQSFELRGRRYIKIYPRLLWNERLNRIENSTTFLDIVRSAVTGPCLGKSK